MDRSAAFCSSRSLRGLSTGLRPSGNDTGQDFLVFDRFAVFATQSQAVPEPGSLLIFGIGGLCVRFVRRSIASP
ncbi:MAG: PEP-CTERM sorting domain-containing protein [Planctomycetota bacterium]|nr:MAG: PEP-CTERM sorting domain-containing protein [Planctomycetota bacterium]RLS98925.1 MAG: PEP-CTERM sorting domain-containing protein [Planctomycetota bacterium]